MQALPQISRRASVTSGLGKKGLHARQFVQRQQTAQRLAGHFLGRVAVQAFRSRAPGLDGAIEGNAENGLLGGIKKSRQ